MGGCNKKLRFLRVLLIAFFIAGLCSCGSSSYEEDLVGNQSENNDEETITPTTLYTEGDYVDEDSDNLILRASYKIDISDTVEGEDILNTSSSLVSKDASASSTASGGGTIFVVKKKKHAEKIKKQSGAPVYTINILDLFEPNLNRCVNKCKSALITIHTDGQGEGYWNEDASSGLPIKADEWEILGGKANALVLYQFMFDDEETESFDLDNYGGQIDIPIEADFTDSTDGTYATKIVLNYLLSN